MDSATVWISINSGYLENIDGIEFKLEYDEDVLELDAENCFCSENNDSFTCVTNSCPITNLESVFYGINTSNLGFIEGIIFSGLSVDIGGEFLSIKFNIKGGIGEYSNITFNELRINDIDLINYTSEGLVTIGNFGCMDFNACNYSSNATFDDDSCEYQYDCSGECGGSAVEDCLGECGGSAIEDCSGECNGIAIIDECGICDGNGISEGTCDCSGTEPLVYCVDGDGDGLGNPSYSFEFCDPIENNENQSLVLDCSDIDDSCDGQFDSCGICNGTGPASNDCCANTGLSVSGIEPDDCGQCGGDMFVDNNGFYPNESCDCEGTPPINYCIDVDGDGDSDSDPISSCYEFSDTFSNLGFIDCATLNIDNVKIKGYSLFSFYPNPFNPSITIEYDIKKTDFMTIKVLDLRGRYLKTLLEGIQTSGKHTINWEPDKKISSGVYLLNIKYGNETFIKKINYIK